MSFYKISYPLPYPLPYPLRVVQGNIAESGTDEVGADEGIIRCGLTTRRAASGGVTTVTSYINLIDLQDFCVRGLLQNPKLHLQLSKATDRLQGPTAEAIFVGTILSSH